MYVQCWFSACDGGHAFTGDNEAVLKGKELYNHGTVPIRVVKQHLGRTQARNGKGGVECWPAWFGDNYYKVKTDRGSAHLEVALERRGFDGKLTSQ